MNAIEVRDTERLPVAKDTANLIRAGVTDNTLKAYRHATQKLEAWLNGQVLDVLSTKQTPGPSRGVKINDRLLAEYITNLHEQGKSPATIALVVAAVKWQAKDLSVDGLSLPITARTLAGIRRAGKGRGRGQVDGLIWQQVERVCTFAEADRTIAGLRDSAMIRLMSDCLLRISEVVAVNCEDVSTVLRLRQSKTDQEGVGATLYICKDTRRVIKRYVKASGISRGSNEPLFRQIRRGDNVQSGQLTDVSARRIIKKRAAAAGVDGFISGHSLRVGSAVSLAKAGASVVDMQTAGRWKNSQMPAHYASAELAERGAIARFKDGVKVTKRGR